MHWLRVFRKKLSFPLSYLNKWESIFLSVSPKLEKHLPRLKNQNPFCPKPSGRAYQSWAVSLYKSISNILNCHRRFSNLPILPTPSQTMSESICRSLRDGALEGELSPTLTIKDTLSSPFAFNVFSHILLQLSSPKSHSNTAILIVALSRSPSFYAHLLKNKGIELSSSNKW